MKNHRVTKDTKNTYIVEVRSLNSDPDNEYYNVIAGNGVFSCDCDQSNNSNCSHIRAVKQSIK